MDSIDAGVYDKPLQYRYGRDLRFSVGDNIVKSMHVGIWTCWPLESRARVCIMQYPENDV